MSSLAGGLGLPTHSLLDVASLLLASRRPSIDCLATLSGLPRGSVDLTPTSWSFHHLAGFLRSPLSLDQALGQGSGGWSSVSSWVVTDWSFCAEDGDLEAV